jgi:phosphatidylglycerophosphatase A
MRSNWLSRLLVTVLLLLILCITIQIGNAEQYANDDGEQDDEAIVEEYVNEYNNKYDSKAEYVDGNGEILYFTELAIYPKRCIQ